MNAQVSGPARAGPRALQHPEAPRGAGGALRELRPPPGALGGHELRFTGKAMRVNDVRFERHVCSSRTELQAAQPPRVVRAAEDESLHEWILGFFRSDLSHIGT